MAVAATSGLLQLTVRMASETESRFTCVERITHYADNLEQEAPEHIKDADPAENWPDQGVVQFARYQMRYRESLSLVLKDVQCNIRPRESVGIVGRTGSGKSSLGVALFRLVEPTDGTILIDGVDISKIGLQSIRSKLSIIPQDPVLFVGTVRYNLDPFNQYHDPELWRALERTYMKDAISGLQKQFEAPVVENGEIFSVDERQLICMYGQGPAQEQQDSLIQKTIHEAFTDCTMLTIAHLLNTVLNSDRIMVMEDGKQVEFDTPAVLMSDPNSRFSAMMAAAGSDVNKYLTNNHLPDVEETDEEEDTKL
ncbi:Multidrug resistance-associated protein 5 [Branchiostoma belcheri]|nr:Multidrug resistance-associated protein 5 [Branchiostoma belcheri]